MIRILSQLKAVGQFSTWPNRGSVDKALVNIKEQLKQHNHRKSIQLLALRYRSVERAREAYATLLPKA